jgi:hypothetical protein
MPDPELSQIARDIHAIRTAVTIISWITSVCFCAFLVVLFTYHH